MKRGVLGDFVQFAYGKGLPARSRKTGSVPVYGSAGVVDTHNVALVRGPGVVVGRKGTVGAVHWADRDFYPIDTTYYVVPKCKDIRMRYVYYLLKTLPASTHEHRCCCSRPEQAERLATQGHHSAAFNIGPNH